MKKIISIIALLALLVSLCCACARSREEAKENITDMLTDASEAFTTDRTTQDNSTTTERAEEPTTDESATGRNPTAAAEQETQVEVSGTEQSGTNEQKMIETGKPDANAIAGFSALAPVEYTAAADTKGLSNKKICHSHGPASGGQPHFTVVEFQNTFDKYGALTLDRKSKGKVLYLTFDCGWEYENLTSKVLDTLKEKKVPAAFFCTLDHIKKQPELIARMIKEGHIVGNHSATHPSFASVSREKMVTEIETTENYLRENFGYSAKYFRFPAGEYTENALDLVSSLGYMSVFWSVAYNDWNVDNIQGKDYAVKTVTDRLHDGAVILLHSVSKDNAEALGEIIDKARSMGYEFKALTDYER